MNAKTADATLTAINAILRTTRADTVADAVCGRYVETGCTCGRPALTLGFDGLPVCTSHDAEDRLAFIVTAIG